jgi:hypothetical protein
VDGTEIVIAAAARTAIGSFAGQFADVSAPELGATAIAAAISRAGITIEQLGGLSTEVYFGNVLQAGLGMNPGRLAALKAGLPVSVPATTINNVCGSGLKAVTMGAQAIRSGEADAVLAGGMENMSRAPYLLPGARFGMRMNDGAVVESGVRSKIAIWGSPPRTSRRTSKSRAPTRTPSPCSASRRPRLPSNRDDLPMRSYPSWFPSGERRRSPSMQMSFSALSPQAIV